MNKMGIIKAKGVVHEFFRRDEEGNVESITTALDHVDLDVTTYENWDDFCRRNPGAKIYYATTKGRHVYSDVQYEPDCFIMFGKESAGIPEEILKANPDTCVRIPMIGETRSLNLSNSVAIVLYEALRQNHFDHMKLEGQLHRLSWDE